MLAAPGLYGGGTVLEAGAGARVIVSAFESLDFVWSFTASFDL